MAPVRLNPSSSHSYLTKPDAEETTAEFNRRLKKENVTCKLYYSSVKKYYVIGKFNNMKDVTKVNELKHFIKDGLK